MVRMCIHTELSTELYEAKNLVFNLLNRTLGNSNLNIFREDGRGGEPVPPSPLNSASRFIHRVAYA